MDRAAVAALGLSDPASAPTHRARMFWARVRAEETLSGPAADALTARALHLDPAVAVDDALREGARALLTQGFAAGRNMADPDVAGAYAAEAHGALAAPALFTSLGAAIGLGRHWHDGSALLPRLDSFRVADTTVAAPWTGQDAEGKDRPVPYAVRASVDLEDSGHVQVTVGTVSYRMPAAEFAELLAADTTLRHSDPSTPVLLVLDGLSGPDAAVARNVSRRLGRPVWWSTSPVELTAPDAADGELPVLAPNLFALTEPTANDWQLTRPAVPDLGGPAMPGAPTGPEPGAPTPATNSVQATNGQATNGVPGTPATPGVPATPATPGVPATPAAPDAEAAPPRSSAGDPMDGLEPTPVPAAATPAAPVAARALPPLPSRTLVAYERDATSPSASGAQAVGRIAAQVAAAGPVSYTHL
ncbi:hypothetical protein [Streptomyces sp. rh34]|uniref:hypothetical protein n=1 Tax=Streptomyces sp. rh34 TaxID=2034272 RepID=UPI000BF08DE4|nr:hypothetical protein [Streptomyces sp. rh34]